MEFIKSISNSRKKKKKRDRRHDDFQAPPIHVLPTTSDSTTRPMEISPDFHASSSSLLHAITLMEQQIHYEEATFAEKPNRRAPSPAVSWFSRPSSSQARHKEPIRTDSPFKLPSEQSLCFNASKSDFSLPILIDQDKYYQASPPPDQPIALSPRPITSQKSYSVLGSPCPSFSKVENGVSSMAHSNSSQEDTRSTISSPLDQTHSVIGLTLGAQERPKMSTLEQDPDFATFFALHPPHHRTISTDTFGVPSSSQAQHSPNSDDSPIPPRSNHLQQRSSPDMPAGSRSPTSPLSYDMPGTPQSYSSYDVTDQAREDGDMVFLSDPFGDEMKRAQPFRDTSLLAAKRQDPVNTHSSQAEYDEASSSSSLHLPLDSYAQAHAQSSWSEARWMEFKARKEQLLAQHAVHKRLKEKWRKLQQRINGDRKGAEGEQVEDENAGTPMNSPDNDLLTPLSHDITPRPMDSGRRNMDYFGLGFAESSGSAQSPTHTRLTPTGYPFYSGKK
ncbi:hypothetical protein FRC03_003988 [Tulasnella sp. 419]|nr:hypothetical protein FRC03_003988 [Tulasnella sp. 419]